MVNKVQEMSDDMARLLDDLATIREYVESVYRMRGWQEALDAGNDGCAVWIGPSLARIHDVANKALTRPVRII